MINTLPDTIHEQIITEIQEILNDKPLYDNLNQYAKQIANNVMSGVKPNLKTKDLIPMFAGTILQRFIPGGENSPGLGSIIGGLGNNIKAQSPHSGDKSGETQKNVFDKN